MSIEEWLLNNGYVIKDGWYMNYDKGIMIELQDGAYPNIMCLGGFYTSKYFELSQVIARFYSPKF